MISFTGDAPRLPPKRHPLVAARLPTARVPAPRGFFRSIRIFLTVWLAASALGITFVLFVVAIAGGLDP